MNFQINIDSIDKFAKELSDESNRLVEIIEYLIRITNDTDTFFDTPTAKVMSEGLIRYLKDAMIKCQNLDNISNKIRIFNKSYKNIYESTKQSVGDIV